MPYKIKKDYGLNRTGGRSLFEIYADFLEYCRMPRQYSDAIERNKLHGERGKPYVAKMHYLGLLEIKWIKLTPKAKKLHLRYQTTEKGIQYISALKYALSFLEFESISN